MLGDPVEQPNFYLRMPGKPECSIEYLFDELGRETLRPRNAIEVAYIEADGATRISRLRPQWKVIERR